MKRRTRIWISMSGAIFLVMSVVFISKAREDARAKFRASDYKSVIHLLNAVIMTSPEIDFKAFKAGKEPLHPLVCRDPIGNPLYSWRFAEFLTLPVPLPHDLPWKADKYDYIRESDTRFHFSNKRDTDTFIFAMGGQDTAFDQTNPTSAKSLPEDLILFADVYQSKTHWMQPGDFNVETLPDKINVPGGLGSEDYPGFFICFVDGQIWRLIDETPITLVKRFCTITAARKADRKIMEPYCREKAQANKENLQWLPQEPPAEKQETQNESTGC